jgi:hypothetical protein
MPLRASLRGGARGASILAGLNGSDKGVGANASHLSTRLR